MSPATDLLTLSEVAFQICRSEAALRNDAARGKLATVKRFGRRYVHREEVDAYVRRQSS